MWKIFRTANIIEIIAIISLFGYGIYQNPPSLRNPEDIAVSIFICAFPLVTALNGIHNISLLGYQITGRKLSLGRKILFWFLLMFLFGVLCLVSYVLVSSFANWKHAQDQNLFDDKRIVIRAIIMYFLMFVIVLNGIYISCMQVLLFFRIKRNYEFNKGLLVDEIGKEISE